MTYQSNVTKIFCGKSQKSKHHLVGFQRKNISQCKQIFLRPDQVNFKEKLVFSFLEADIPLYKLSHPALKSRFAAMEKVLPSETAACVSVAQLASQKKSKSRTTARKKIFFIVDKAEVAI